VLLLSVSRVTTLMRTDDDARRKRRLRLRSRNGGRRWRDWGGFRNEYRGIDSLRKLRGAGRRFGFRSAGA
jgi:hypothetical protein